MEETTILDQVKPSEKIYNERSIAVGAFLGGPLAVGYLLDSNFKNTGKGDRKNKVWGITIGCFIAYLAFAFFIPTGLSNVVLPITCVAVARQVFKQFQEEDLNAHLNNEGEVHSSWRAAGIGGIFAILTITLSFMVIMLLPSKKFAEIMLPEAIETPVQQNSSSSNVTQSAVSSLETKSYGDAAHVIVYDELSFSETEIDAIADQLTTLNFFDATNQKYVYLKKLLFDYEFSITDASADMEDAATRTIYEKLRVDMETFLEDGKVVILLKDENLEVVLGRFGEEI